MVKIYRSIILSVLLYEYETWSHMLREEHRLRVSENRLFKSIFRPKRGEVTEGWRKWHNDELHSLYSSANNIRVIKSVEFLGSCLTSTLKEEERQVDQRRDGRGNSINSQIETVQNA
jgi:type II secretory pathway component PulL